MTSDNGENPAGGESDGKPKNGRPPCMTPAVVDLVVKAVGEGLPLRSAAHLAGVSLRSVQRHKQHDPAFVTALKSAAAKHEGSLVRAIAAASQWQAQAFLLARRYTRGWGRHREGDALPTGMPAPGDAANPAPRLLPLLVRDRTEVMEFADLQRELAEARLTIAELRGVPAG